MSSPASPVSIDTGRTTPNAVRRVESAPPFGIGSLIPVQTRSERFSSTDPEDFPEVSGLEFEWKFSQVARLRPLIGGPLDGSPWSYLASEVAGVDLDWIDRSDSRIGGAGVPEDRASANAWTSFEKALSVTIDGELDAPATITRSALDAAPRAAHVLVTAKPNSRGTIVLQNTGKAFLSENVEIVVQDGADLTVVTVQEWDADAIHLATHFSSIGKDARLKHIVVSLEGSIVRVNSAAHLVGAGADVELDGAYFAGDGQHIEQQVFVDHVAPSTRSRVTYKGALQGSRARSVWIGDVLIRRSAVGTDSYEQNRNLLLTSGARADSIPNLEIETGDIAGAGHASASGRFDDEQLFYLQARGISESEARRLIVRGFLSEVVQKIGVEPLELRLQAAIEAALVPEGAR
jgi:Fe-S cluster assembly protein SufD